MLRPEYYVSKFVISNKLLLLFLLFSSLEKNLFLRLSLLLERNRWPRCGSKQGRGRGNEKLPLPPSTLSLPVFLRFTHQARKRPLNLLFSSKISDISKRDHFFLLRKQNNLFSRPTPSSQTVRVHVR